MPTRIKISIGDRFGKLVVLRNLGLSANQSAKWECRCDCGNLKTTISSYLKDGRVVSCGCYKKEVLLKLTRENIIHGQSNRFCTPEYRAWQAIKKRCYNKNEKYYGYYGGRGISVSDRWLGSNGFQNFFKDVGPKPQPKNLYSLDRIDNDGNYEPGNVRWATRSEQSKNRRTFLCLENYSDEQIKSEFVRRGLQIEQEMVA